MTTPATPTTKIIIVAGQEFSVPADTNNEDVRKQLSSMGFADVASATIQTGSRVLDGQEIPTVEFIKKAGTKGMESADLVTLIARVPADRSPVRRRGPTLAQQQLLIALAAGGLTMDAALRADLSGAFDAATPEPSYMTPGRDLCRRLTARASAASIDVLGW